MFHNIFLSHDCVPSCGAWGLECCSGSCDSGLYCANGGSDADHCCFIYDVWYDDLNACGDGESFCGLGANPLCVSSISSDFDLWYGDSDCLSFNPSTGCCYVFRYNEWDYYPEDITTY